MPLAKVTCHAKPDADHDLVEDALHGYIFSMMKNGQVADGEVLAGWQGDTLVGYDELVRPEASRNKFNSDWVNRSLKKLKEYVIDSPKWEIIGDHPSRYPRWDSADSFYLCADFYPSDGPLFRGNDGSTVPLYRIPIDQVSRQDIISWRREYISHFDIWLRSRSLEFSTYKVIADPRSDLSGTGRDLCRTVEKASGIPTYYYLMRHYGREDEEETRLCPVCGKSWVIEENLWNLDAAFCDFPYRCKKCRLVSHTLCAVNKRYARVGEYRP